MNPPSQAELNKEMKDSALETSTVLFVPTGIPCGRTNVRKMEGSAFHSFLPSTVPSPFSQLNTRPSSIPDYSMSRCSTDTCYSQESLGSSLSKDDTFYRCRLCSAEFAGSSSALDLIQHHKRVHLLRNIQQERFKSMSLSSYNSACSIQSISTIPKRGANDDLLC